MTLYIFDSRHVWWEAIAKAAEERGIRARRIGGIEDVDDSDPDSFAFVRPHPAMMPAHRELDADLRSMMPVIQDRAQVEVYEDKSEQWRRWGHMLPDTLVTTSRQEAEGYTGPFPVVSKANEGASSVNVRIIQDMDSYRDHIAQIWGNGIRVSRCADKTFTTQRGYIYLQRFIPHEITYRVNIVGNHVAIFERHNYPDRPVSQTGNTDNVMDLTPMHESLLDYAWGVADTIGSRFVALDILDDSAVSGDEENPEQEVWNWTLIETSLAWPWSATDRSNTPLWLRSGGQHGTWGDLWAVMLDDWCDGAFTFT